MRPGGRRRGALTALCGAAASAWLALLGLSAYASIVSNVDPRRLYRPILPGVHLRTDTTGATACALSVGAFVLWQRLTYRSDPSWRTLVARTCILYGTLAAAYTAAHAVTHPSLLPVQLTHLFPWPTELQFGLAGLGACAVGLALRRHPDRRPPPPTPQG